YTYCTGKPRYQPGLARKEYLPSEQTLVAELSVGEREVIPKWAGARRNALGRTLPRDQDRTIRLPVFRDLDDADAVEQMGGDVVRHHLAERRQRPVGVGAAHGKINRPGIDRCAALGAYDDRKFRIALRAPA